MNTILFMIGFILIILFTLNLVTSHGKSKISDAFLVFYGLAAGLPLIFASYLIWGRNEKGIVAVILIALSLAFVSILLAIKWSFVFKGRESFLQTLALTIGIMFIYISYLFSPGQAMVFIGIGYLFMAIFFIQMFRYPYLHPGWLASAIEEVKLEIKTKGKYSPKPIVIKRGINKRFFTGARGLSLLIKNDRVVCRMSRKLHIKLGEPNMEDFFDKLVERILQK